MLAALVASIHKTEPPGGQVLEVLAACCLPQLLGQTAAVENKIRIKSSQGEPGEVAENDQKDVCGCIFVYTCVCISLYIPGRAGEDQGEPEEAAEHEQQAVFISVYLCACISL